VLRELAVALSVSVDVLLFYAAERGPTKSNCWLQFEALSAMPAEEKESAKAMLEAIILKNQVARPVKH
jgi:hypothetical protein